MPFLQKILPLPTALTMTEARILQLVLLVSRFYDQDGPIIAHHFEIVSKMKFNFRRQWLEWGGITHRRF